MKHISYCIKTDTIILFNSEIITFTMANLVHKRKSILVALLLYEGINKKGCNQNFTRNLKIEVFDKQIKN